MIHRILTTAFELKSARGGGGGGGFSSGGGEGQSINFHCFHLLILWSHVVWLQAGERTNNNLTPQTRTHRREGGERKNTQRWRGREGGRDISITEHIVIKQRDEMCEAEKRRVRRGNSPCHHWQDNR